MSTSNKINDNTNNNSINCQTGSHSQIDAYNNKRDSIKDDTETTTTTTISIDSDKNNVTTTLINPTTSITSSAATSPIANESNNTDKEIRLEQSRSQPDLTQIASPNRMTIPEATSDFNQWLHAMKMVARLPGGMPIEFRRKLWLALSERYLKKRGVDWEKEQVKWFSEKCRADDEELGDQIMKDLHRTGSSLCSGPSGTVNQAKLKRLLIGFTRWNPEVGYCQGFNMLGALILQVMEKNEEDAIKVMIFLIEGLLPPGYFHGSLGGLQADMAVFRELLGTKLPKLARHLQKLQNAPNEASFEPPLTNVFTMQWFLTLFCNCLPMNCVLRIWDLIIIEGSDVLLRTALVIWQLFEDRILKIKSADDFYCKMESLSSELLNGSLIDSNGLVQKISDLGPIPELQKMRSKHLESVNKNQKELKLLSSGDDNDTEDPRVTAAAWGIRSNRRGSSAGIKGQSDREKIALDINILKKQYDKLRERQKQAHIILTSASKQTVQSTSSGLSSMNKLLVGKNAIVSKGRRMSAPKGAIPPARIAHKPIKSTKIAIKQSKAEEPVNWKEMKDNRRNTMKWKDIKSDRKESKELVGADVKLPHSASASSIANLADQISPKRRSESSSYSENSESESSSSTSLCDEDIAGCSASSIEASPLKKRLMSEVPEKHKKHSDSKSRSDESRKSHRDESRKSHRDESRKSHCDRPEVLFTISDVNETPTPTEYLDLPSPLDGITSTSQLSPMPDISKYISESSISPIKSPSKTFNFTELIEDFEETLEVEMKQEPKFEVDEQGVTNEFFERVTSSDRLNELRLGEYLLSNANPTFNYNLDNNHDNDNEIPPYRSSLALELPIVTNSSSIIPPCTDISTITSEQSPSICKTNCDNTDSHEFKLTDPQITSTANFRYKSLSVDAASTEEKEVSSINRSVSDGTISADNSKSDGMKKIIEENLKILDQISMKNSQIYEETTEDIVMEEVEKIESPSRSSDKQEALKSSVESDDWIDPNVYEHPITHSPPRHTGGLSPETDKTNPKYSRAYSISDDKFDNYETTESTDRKSPRKYEDSKSSSIDNEMTVSLSSQHSLSIDKKSDYSKSPQRSFESGKSKSPEIQSPVSLPKATDSEIIAKEIFDDILKNVENSEQKKPEKPETKRENSTDSESQMSESMKILKKLNYELERCKSTESVESNTSRDSKHELSFDKEKPSKPETVTVAVPKDHCQKTEDQKSDSEKILEKLNMQLEKCTGQKSVEPPKKEEKVLPLEAPQKPKDEPKDIPRDIPKEESKSIDLSNKNIKTESDTPQKEEPKIIKEKRLEKSDSEKILEKLNSQLEKCSTDTKKTPTENKTDKTENYKENAVEAEPQPAKSESDKILEKLNSHLGRYDEDVDKSKAVKVEAEKKEVKIEESEKSESDKILEKLNKHLDDKVPIPDRSKSIDKYIDDKVPAAPHKSKIDDPPKEREIIQRTPKIVIESPEATEDEISETDKVEESEKKLEKETPEVLKKDPPEVLKKDSPEDLAKASKVNSVNCDKDTSKIDSKVEKVETNDKKPDLSKTLETIEMLCENMPKKPETKTSKTEEIKNKENEKKKTTEETEMTKSQKVETSEDKVRKIDQLLEKSNPKPLKSPTSESLEDVTLRLGSQRSEDELKKRLSDEKLKSPEPIKFIGDELDSERILEKLNQQLERCSDSKKHERTKSETYTSPKRGNEYLKKDISLSKIHELQWDKEEDSAETLKSHAILEKLNAQLTKYDEENSKGSRKSFIEDSNSLEYSKKSNRKSLIDLEKLLSESDSDDTSKSFRERRSSPSKNLFEEKRNKPESYTNALFDLYGTEYKSETKIKEYYADNSKLLYASSNSSRCSSPSNISETLSSIQHTIKSLDTMCTQKPNYNKAMEHIEKICKQKPNYNKAMEDVEKICKSDDWKPNKDKNRKSDSPTFRIDDFEPKTVTSIPFEQKDRATLKVERPSRSRTRSPRRREEPNRIRKTSPKVSTTPTINSNDEKTNTLYDSYYNRRNNKDISHIDFSRSIKSPTSPTKYSDNLDIRHSTVTLSHYDKYFNSKGSQKIDRSPTSPILSNLSKSYDYSPKSPVKSPTFSSPSIYLNSPSYYESRTSKSAETSPSRYDYLKQPSPTTTTRLGSCSNIPRKFTDKYFEDKYKNDNLKYNSDKYSYKSNLDYADKWSYDDSKKKYG